MNEPAAIERDADRVVGAKAPFRQFPPTSGRREARFQAVCRQSVLNDIHSHGASTPEIEICGVLVGDVYKDDDGPYLYVEASIRGEHASNLAAQVTFTAATWAHIHECMDKHPGKKIVGWYHTHPGFGIFLSAADLFIHENFFNVPWQVAFVYDPQSRDEGMFFWRAGKATREPFLVEADVPTEGDSSLRQETCVAQARESVEPFMACVERLERRFTYLVVAFTLGMLFILLWPYVLPEIQSYLSSRAIADSHAPAKNGEDVPE